MFPRRAVPPKMPPLSDAFVFFGATGDLAYKQIFPSLQQMIKRGNLNVPVIGVAKAGWTLEQFRARARGQSGEAWRRGSSRFLQIAGVAELY